MTFIQAERRTQKKGARGENVPYSGVKIVVITTPQKLKTIFRNILPTPTPSYQTIHCSADDTAEENLKALLPTFSLAKLNTIVKILHRKRDWV